MDSTTFQIGQPPARIDTLQHIDGVTFDEAWANRIEGIADLLRLMVLTGCEKDRDDSIAE